MKVGQYFYFIDEHRAQLSEKTIHVTLTTRKARLISKDDVMACLAHLNGKVLFKPLGELHDNKEQATRTAQETMTMLKQFGYEVELYPMGD